MIEIEGEGLRLIGVYEAERDSKFWETKGRDFSVLSMRMNGKAEFFTSDGEYTVQANDVLYCPPYSEYAQRTDGERVIYIHFYEEKSEKKLSGLRFDFNAVDVREKFEALYKAFREKRLGYNLKCMSLLYEILYRLKTRLPNLSSRIRSVIDENFTDPDFTIAELADKVGFSETYVRRVFFKTFGVSPSEYLISERLLHAKNLLESGYYKVYDAAFLSGYADEKYFSVAFRKKFGCSPSSLPKGNFCRR